MKTDPPTAERVVATGRRGGFSAGFWATIILFATLFGLAQWRMSTWFSEEVTSLSAQLGGERAPAQGGADDEELHTVALPPEVRIKRRLLTLTFKKGEERFAEAHLAMRAEVTREFDHIRGESDGLVRSWADWYYSVTGEYTRLLKLLLSAAGEKSVEAAKRAASRYMSEQVKSQLIDPINADQRITELERRLTEQMRRLNTSVLAELKAQMSALEESAEREGRVHQDDLTLLRSRERDLELLSELNVVSPVALATKALSVGGTKLLLSGGLKAGAKVATSAGAKAGLKAGGTAGAKAGLKVGQAVAAKVAGKGLIKSAVALWGKMLVKFGIKATAKGGGAAAAATTGTVACSFLGPWAFACGVAAGTAAWFAVDKVVVEIDELLNRDQFEAELRRDLSGSWSEVEAELITALDAHFLRVQALIRSDLEHRPAQKTTLMKALQGDDRSQVPPSPQRPAE